MRATFKVLFYVNRSKEKKITTEKLNTDLTAFGDKLSASFNNITQA